MSATEKMSRWNVRTRSSMELFAISIGFFLLMESGLVEGNKRCSAVKSDWMSKGFGDGQQVPSSPVAGNHLSVCSAWGRRSVTCCSREMESRLTSVSKRRYEEMLADKLNELRQNFTLRTTAFENFCTELIDKSSRELHDMFTRTYGILYQQNSHVFSELFRDLRTYYRGGQLDLEDVLDSFFSSLLLRMFTLLNSQYVFDERYLGCIGERAGSGDLAPFGDVPQKLKVQVKRAFVAARTFRQGLGVGRDAVGALTKMELSSDCHRSVTRMLYCPYCSGLVGVKPCNSYCTDSLQTCLSSQHTELSDVWTNYIESMLKVAERLDGPFNIENVLDPMDVKISEAIMNFQENAEAVTAKVFQACGQPSLGIRNRRDTDVARTERRPQQKKPGTRSTTVIPGGEFDLRTSPKSSGNRQRVNGGGSRRKSTTPQMGIPSTPVPDFPDIILGNLSEIEISAIGNNGSAVEEELMTPGNPGKTDSEEIDVSVFPNVTVRINDGWMEIPTVLPTTITTVVPTTITTAIPRTTMQSFPSRRQVGESRSTSTQSTGKTRQTVRGGRRRTRRPNFPQVPTTRLPITTVVPERDIGAWESPGSGPSGSGSTHLERLIGDLKSMLGLARNFVTGLPTAMCGGVAETRGGMYDDQCWNGTSLARYTPSGDIGNVRAVSDTRRSGVAVNRVVQQLQQITDKLRRAYGGLDVDWLDSDGSENSRNPNFNANEDDEGDDDDDLEDDLGSGSGRVPPHISAPGRPHFKPPVNESPYRRPPQPPKNVDFYGERPGNLPGGNFGTGNFPVPPVATRRPPLVVTSGNVYVPATKSRTRTNSGAGKTSVAAALRGGVLYFFTVCFVGAFVSRLYV